MQEVIFQKKNKYYFIYDLNKVYFIYFIVDEGNIT